MGFHGYRHGGGILEANLQGGKQAAWVGRLFHFLLFGEIV